MPDPSENDATEVPGPEGAGLSRPLQEHLGRQLRAAYHEIEDKPAYLGDPVMPPAFEAQIERLERGGKAHDAGVAAVRAALADLAAEPDEEAGKG